MDPINSLNLIFDPSEDAAIHWAARTGLEHALELRTAEQLYARALPYIKNWAWALTTKHGWTEEAVDSVGDMPLAVCLGRDQLLQGVNGDRTYVARLVLPLYFSDFLNPEFTHDWAAMFSHLTTSYQSNSDPADIFQLGRAGIPRPLQNILYLLQILSPGLLIVQSMATDEDDEEEDAAEWGPQGIDLALPPSIWVGLHIEDLEDIFGAQTAVKLYQASEDPYCASEESVSDRSYESQYDSEQFSDSSYYATSDYPEDEDEEEEFDVDGEEDYDHFPVLYDQSKGGEYLGEQPDQLSKFDPGHEYEFASKHPELNHHLIPDVGGGGKKSADGLEYRHCDSDCAFCGLCSSRFADRLTERLLMHVL